MDKKEIKITFAPGCFDEFEGTQEELDEMVAEIQRLADSGELFDDAMLLDLDDLEDYEDLETEVAVVVDKIIERENNPKRLH